MVGGAVEEVLKAFGAVREFVIVSRQILEGYPDGGVGVGKFFNDLARGV